MRLSFSASFQFRKLIPGISEVIDNSPMVSNNLWFSTGRRLKRIISSGETCFLGGDSAPALADSHSNGLDGPSAFTAVYNPPHFMYHNSP